MPITAHTTAPVHTRTGAVRTAAPVHETVRAAAAVHTRRAVHEPAHTAAHTAVHARPCTPGAVCTHTPPCTLCTPLTCVHTAVCTASLGRAR